VLVGAILGLATLTVVVIGNALKLFSIAWTWYVALGTCVTFGVGWAASWITGWSGRERAA
jgi:uncharacterized membrane protein